MGKGDKDLGMELSHGLNQGNINKIFLRKKGMNMIFFLSLWKRGKNH
jgi:hypothetical protein